MPFSLLTPGLEAIQLAVGVFVGVVIWGAWQHLTLENYVARKQQRERETKARGAESVWEAIMQAQRRRAVVESSAEAQACIEELRRWLAEFERQQRRAAATGGPGGWARTLQLTLPTTHQEAKQAYYRLSQLHHPDITGSDGTMQQQLNAAREEALRWLQEPRTS